MRQINIGDVLTCAETGKTFTAQTDGFTYNFATGRDGAIISDEGVDIREKREMLDRSLPFCCYLSSDGKRVTGWKGNTLGRVLTESTSRTGWHRSTLTHIVVQDVHGAQWYGKGAGRGMCIRLHARKSKPLKFTSFFYAPPMAPQP
jgi:hypothetical protein